MNAEYKYWCVIRRIVDGDTVDIDIDLGFDNWLHNERVRLKGIDAPEVRTSDDEEKYYGKLATDYVEEKLPVGSKQLYVSQEYQRGKYGRSLGDFLIDMPSDWKIDESKEDPGVGVVFLTEMMMRDHHAVKYRTGDDAYLMEQDHLENREQLKNSGQG